MDGEVKEVRTEEPIAEVPVIGGEVDQQTADLIRGFLINRAISVTTCHTVFDAFHPGEKVTADFERAFRSVVSSLAAVPE
jgi:hypothetical protein